MRTLLEKERMILVRMSKRNGELKFAKKKSREKKPVKASHLLMHAYSYLSYS
jgi:hypothetical protein